MVAILGLYESSKYSIIQQKEGIFGQNFWKFYVEMRSFLAGMEISWAVFVSVLNLTALQNNSLKVFFTRHHD